MTEEREPPEGPPPEPEGGGGLTALEQESAGGAITPAARLAAYVRGGGIVVPILTAGLAFFVGGLVMLFTGSDPIATYEAIWNGTGLQWFLPWTTDRETAALNLQQTLIVTTPLILTGLAVAFAFRAGLFNIGGQGQYIVGAIAAVWVGSELGSLPGAPHVILAIVAACAAGALWAGIAGFLKASTGANEVISTIMLNYVALWIGVYLFSLGGPLQNDRDPSLPVSNDIVEAAHLPVFWGDPVLQGLHIGIFVALLAALAFWLLLNRSTTGYEVRAVGLNPEAARYSGMNVGKNYVLVMAVCGLFAGLAGSLDVLGWQFRLATNDIQETQYGFLGIAVALLGRNTASGTVAAALLFGALVSGTSQRNLDPTIFEPSLASNLTLIIQGLVVLIVSADVLVLSALRRGRGLVGRGPGRPGPTPATVEARAMGAPGEDR
ncbi:MAG TPA: ABC transporter permease [Thermoleophilaceae bacterium]|nr:ABC transporter permease [Thermoleophilaceae bacterium]